MGILRWGKTNSVHAASSSSSSKWVVSDASRVKKGSSSFSSSSFEILQMRQKKRMNLPSQQAALFLFFSFFFVFFLLSFCFLFTFVFQSSIIIINSKHHLQPQTTPFTTRHQLSLIRRFFQFRFRHHKCRNTATSTCTFPDISRRSSVFFVFVF